MESAHALNLIDIDFMVGEFLSTNKTGISTIHKIYFKTDDKLSLKALIESLKDELRTGCVTFINKGSPLDELQGYLFYIVNAHCRKTSIPESNRKTEYVCPGCLFLGIPTLIISDKPFRCEECSTQEKVVSDPKLLCFYKTFAIHSKKGYRCQDCNRFIPQPLDSTTNIVCPYFDCMFVGDCKNLHNMHHPTSQTNPEKLVLDVIQDNGGSLKDMLSSKEDNAQISLEIKEELFSKVKIIQDVINSQISHVAYSGSEFTIKHKQLVYQAFQVLLQRQPEEMVSYLLEGSRSGGFQHKVFQEYIKLLEGSFPFFIKKGKHRYRIDNLLDEHLCIFSGISIFNASINDKLIIKNGTTEFYIGGRKASYTEPYYIGKLLNVVRVVDKEPILHLVKEYSFSRIRMKNIAPGTDVMVTHLRIPPHYQMGGMVYVNRVRKKIIERAKILLERNSDE